jgi:hypothetical protein
MRSRTVLTVMIWILVVAFFGCGGGGSGVGDGGSGGDADLAVVTRIDDKTGFVVMVDGATDTHVTNALGAEGNPFFGVFAHNGYVFTTGSRANDMLTKYAVNDDNSLTKVAEVNVYEGGNSVPSFIIFVNDTKAYLALPGVGELVVFDPTDLSITNRIDLSPWAMDENGEFGGQDHNPEPAAGVIRDGKLYLALGQIDTIDTFFCRGKASVLIIDVATDEVEKHISDDRTCNSGNISPNNGLILDENGDIYVNNPAGFGYYGDNSGFLRIKNGEEEFDPDYYFSITGLAGLDVPGGVASYAYNYVYTSDGDLYTNLMIPGLTSDTPDYGTDKNYVPYVLNLRDQTATKLDMVPSTGWSSHLIDYNGEIVYAQSTVNGTGLYYADEQTPFLTIAGDPCMVAQVE